MTIDCPSEHTLRSRLQVVLDRMNTDSILFWELLAKVVLADRLSRRIHVCYSPDSSRLSWKQIEYRLYNVFWELPAKVAPIDCPPKLASHYVLSFLPVHSDFGQ